MSRISSVRQEGREEVNPGGKNDRRPWHEHNKLRSGQIGLHEVHIGTGQKYEDVTRHFMIGIYLRAFSATITPSLVVS